MSPSNLRRDDRLESLLNASLLLNSTLSMGDILHTLSLHATQHTQADRTTLYLVEGRSKMLVSEIAQGDEVQQVRVAVGEGIAGIAAATGRTLHVPDAYADDRFDRTTDRQTGYRTKSMVAVPIKDRTGTVIGVLQVLNKKRGEFVDDDIRYLGILAGHAAVAIQNARTYETLARERDDLQAENIQLRRRGQSRVQLIGSHPRLREALEMAEAVAGSTANVLLRGESGTGKGVFAKYIHQRSSRSRGPFVSINCSAIPADLIESELFGIERGVATGVEARKGRLEAANQGTCFLDEIGDMSGAAQAKILKVIEDREIERVGGRQAFPLDVRVVAATHKDLERAIRDREFRQDLYYRLNVVSIWLPALRNRGQDVLELAQFFAQYFAKANGRGRLKFSPETMAMLQAYGWPGNVRELQNVVERAVILSRGPVLEPSVLPPELRSDISTSGAQLVAMAPVAPPPDEGPAPEEASLRDSLEEYEKALIRGALRRASGVQIEAARALGISESNLRYKLKKFGLAAGSASG